MLTLLGLLDLSYTGDLGKSTEFRQWRGLRNPHLPVAVDSSGWPPFYRSRGFLPFSAHRVGLPTHASNADISLVGYFDRWNGKSAIWRIGVISFPKCAL